MYCVYINPIAAQIAWKKFFKTLVNDMYFPEVLLYMGEKDIKYPEEIKQDQWDEFIKRIYDREDLELDKSKKDKTNDTRTLHMF